MQPTAIILFTEHETGPILKLMKIIYILTAYFSQRVLIVSFQVP